MRALTFLFAALALASCATVPTSGTPAITPALRAEFAPSGTLIMGTNYGNIVHTQRDPAGGAPRGVAPELARELARRLGVPIKYVTYEIAGKMADAVKENAWDIAFLAVDPARAESIAFSEPYVLIEGSYLVKQEAPMRRVEDFDRPGLRIAVGLKSAYDLYLSRVLKQAELVRYPTSQAAIDAFVQGKDGLGAAAGVRQPLAIAAKKDSRFRVIEGAYMSIGQAAGVPRSRPLAARYLHDFIEEMKANGFVARKLAESGNADATVAPPK
ncbi:MAG TPA: transporter substrate-binding domain-containing protein [Usitatibacter sp.]|nr:transporter substrate-binding domain-containing protein [Usitatibacter sp.]